MATYSKVVKATDVDVKNVNTDFFETFVDSSPGSWREVTDSTKNKPTVGCTYNLSADAYYPPRPSEEYELNTSTYQWELIKPYPSDGYTEEKRYYWDKDLQDWVVRS